MELQNIEDFSYITAGKIFTWFESHYHQHFKNIFIILIG